MSIAGRRLWSGFVFSAVFAVMAAGAGAAGLESSGPSSPTRPAWRPETTRDSIRVLLTAQSFPAANEIAARYVATTERRFGRGSRETIGPMLLQAEVLVSSEPTKGEGLRRIDEIARLIERRGASAMERAMVEHLRGVADSLADFERRGAHLAAADSIFRANALTETHEYAMNVSERARSFPRWGKTPEEVQRIEQACRIYERLYGPENPFLFDVMDRLALSESHAGDPARSLEIYDRVLAGLKRTLGEHAPRLIGTYYRMSAIYSDMGGQTDRVKELCDAGLEVIHANPQLSRTLMPATISDMRGWVAEDEGDYALAESLYLECVRLVSAMLGFDSIAAMYARTHHASALLGMGRYSDAEREWDALAALLQGKPDEPVLEIVNGLAICALARGDTATARERFWKCSELLGDNQQSFFTRNGNFHRDVAIGLSFCDGLTGRTGDAFDRALRLEHDCREQLRGAARSLSDLDALAMAKTAKEGGDLALTALLGSDLPEEDVGRGFDMVVRSRAVALSAITARHLATRAAGDSATVALADRLEAIARSRAELSTRAASAASAESAEQLEAEERAILTRLASRSEPLGRTYREDLIGGMEVRAALGPRDHLLSFVRFGRWGERTGAGFDLRKQTPWYAAFVASPDAAGVRFFDLGPAKEIDAQIERWRDLVTTSPAPPESQVRLHAVGDSLRRRLWDPLVANTSGDARIHVVADGSIALIPFTALPDARKGFLLESAPPVDYVSTERDLVHPAPDRRADATLVLGDPDFAKSSDALLASEVAAVSTFRGKTSSCEEFRTLMFSRVTESGAEARDVAAIANDRGLPCTLLVGPEASEEAFKRLAPESRIVHVASHGFALSGRCEAARGAGETSLVRAGIALAGANARGEAGRDREDGILTAEEVSVMDLTGAECVVLSTCESGVGEVVTGEGVLGMRRAFHEAGASTLVASLWPVDDAATRAWMREFYRGLLGGGAEPVDASRDASLRMLRRMRKAGQEPSPALWGGFVVCGEGRASAASAIASERREGR